MPTYQEANNPYNRYRHVDAYIKQHNERGSVSAYACNYLRVNDTVICSGVVNIDPTTELVATFGISLPVASDFTTVYQCRGTANSAGQETMRKYWQTQRTTEHPLVGIHRMGLPGI